MRKLIFSSILLSSLYGVDNPYKNLNVDEKINIMANYFFNEELKTKLPQKPIKENQEVLDEINPTKYERYYTYIERLKILRREYAQEKQRIAEEYAGKVGYYNGNLKTLYKFYSQKKNQDTLLQNSINKAMKIFYGQPKIKNLKYDSTTDKINAQLFTNNFYGYRYRFEYPISIDVPKEHRDNFIDKYREAKIKINSYYSGKDLVFDSIIVSFLNMSFKGDFEEEVKEKVNLNIKIDKEMFEPIIIKEEKEINEKNSN